MTQRGRGRPPHPGILTPAERRVLAELRRGGTNAEIAVRLGVTLDAVKFHISNMLGKLELDSRHQLAAWRPERRRRLFGLLAVPGTLEPIGRLLVWTGVAAAGAVAVAVVAVVLIVLSSLDGSEQQPAFAPTATPTAATPAPTDTPTPTATPTATPAATPTPAATAAVTATPTPAVCKTSADPTCIRAVYLGAPGDYAQVADIPADVLLTADADGRYHVERGQQVTVVTAAPLPAGYTRFWLDWSPLEFGTPSPVSASQLIQPVGTAYTFTVTEDEAASTLITFDLKQARPFVRPRPDGKPELGAAVVTTVFSVATSSPRYNSYDTTGAVATAGSYAFLADPADTTTAVTTYEALRDGTTTALLIHKSDAHGASQAALYDAVETGDLFEWHEADDCFVRYKVTEVKPDPADAVPRKLLAVEWMTYAFTGCSGAVSADTVATVDWGELPDLGGASLTVPIRHGTWQLVPVGWAGSIELDRLDLPPVQSIDLYRDDPDGFFSTADPVVARRELPYWRDPALPAGLRLYRADSGTWDGPLYGYCAEWGLSDRYGPAIHICGYHAAYSGLPTTASQLNGRLAYMTGVVAGRAAMLEYYSPAGSNQTPTVLYGLRIYDVATQSGYELHVEDPSFDVIAITRSLFESPNPQ